MSEVDPRGGDPKYYDQFGQVKGHSSENGVGPNNLLFTVQHWMLWMALRDPIYQIQYVAFAKYVCGRRITDGVFKQTQTSPETKIMSHDDMTAMLSWAYVLGWYWTIRNVKIWKGFAWSYKPKDWLYYPHPRDILYYNWLKGGWRRWAVRPFYWLMIPIQLWSLVWNYGKSELDTDGDLLTWVRCQATRKDSWVMTISWWINNRLINLGVLAEYDIWNQKDFFAYYFKEEGHPNRNFSWHIYEGDLR